MTIYNHFVENFFLPLSDLIMGTKVHKTMSFMHKSQWWSHDKLTNYQNRLNSEKVRAVYFPLSDDTKFLVG